MKKTSKVLALVLALIVALSFSVSAYSSKEMTESVSGWLTKNITVAEAEKNVDSYLDWTVFAMQRGENSAYKAEYKAYIGGAVSAHYDELYLSDFTRISLSAMSVGLNPKNIGGHNLLEAIVDTDLSKEAFTGSIAYAIIALNSAHNYSPEKQTELKNLLLSAQREDGGFNSYIVADPAAYWTMSGETDSTGIALQALALFMGESKVDTAIAGAVDFLKSEQMADGGFGSWGSASAESISQVIAGLCAVGIDPLSAEFAKDGKTMLTSLSSFINADGGARCWDGSSNIMTGYQLLCGLNAYERFSAGRAGIYELSAISVACHNVRASFVGQKLPSMANVICSIMTSVYNLFGMEIYK